MCQVFRDGDLDKKDYEQRLNLVGGVLDHKIFTEVDEEDIRTGLFFDENYAVYNFEFQDTVGLSSDEIDDYVGEEIEIMGNSFTVVDIDDSKLTLVGGSSKVSIKEGDTKSFTIEGQTVEVAVEIVDTERVYLKVNGQSESLRLYDTEKIGGVQVAVTEVFSPSRDNSQAAVELVIGGQKVELDGSTIRINDESFSDIDKYDSYDVNLDITSTEVVFSGFTITYSLRDEMALNKGEYLIDPVFGAFKIVYEGLNDVDYSELKITSSSDDVSFSGKLNGGDSIPSVFALSTQDENDGGLLYLGDKNSRILFEGSKLATGQDYSNSNAMEDGSLDFTSLNTVEFNLASSGSENAIEDIWIFDRADDDSVNLYEISSFDDRDLDLDVKGYFDASDDSSVKPSEFQNSLDLDQFAVVFDDTSDSTGLFTLNTNELRNPTLYLENELEMDFSNVESLDFTSNSDSNVPFSYNREIDAEDETFVDYYSFTLDFDRNSNDYKDDIRISLNSSYDNFVNNGGEGDDESRDSGNDNTVYVDIYGTKLTLTNDDQVQAALIEVPDKEVEAKVSLVFGGDVSSGGNSVREVVVDTDAVSNKVAELKADGYTIVSQDTVEPITAEFDVTAPVLDSSVTGNSGLIVIGGPAVNSVARDLLGITTYDVSQAGISQGENVVRYYTDQKSVLVYGYSAEGTVAAARELNTKGY